MKTEILNIKENREIDWSKPQWVIFEELVIFTNGKHNENSFTGTCLPCDGYKNGEFSDAWCKEGFQPIPQEGLTIKISNND